MYRNMSLHAFMSVRMYLEIYVCVWVCTCVLPLDALRCRLLVALLQPVQWRHETQTSLPLLQRRLRCDQQALMRSYAPSMEGCFSFSPLGVFAESPSSTRERMSIYLGSSRTTPGVVTDNKCLRISSIKKFVGTTRARWECK